MRRSRLVPIGWLLPITRWPLSKAVLIGLLYFLMAFPLVGIVLALGLEQPPSILADVPAIYVVCVGPVIETVMLWLVVSMGRWVRLDRTDGRRQALFWIVVVLAGTPHGMQDYFGPKFLPFVVLRGLEAGLVFGFMAFQLLAYRRTMRCWKALPLVAISHGVSNGSLLALSKLADLACGGDCP